MTRGGSTPGIRTGWLTSSRACSARPCRNSGSSTGLCPGPERAWLEYGLDGHHPGRHGPAGGGGEGLQAGRGDLCQIPDRVGLTAHSGVIFDTLQEDRPVLLQRYHLRDVAFKVVGVGSVGTFCAVGLFMSDGDAPLLLQIKEAQQSVLAPFAGPSDYPNHGQRVVVGQRMLQAAADVFLGWTESAVDGRYFYVRRLKDQRLADIGARLAAALPFYAGLCGRTLARAHARSGDAASLSGYIGDSAEFDKAIAEFARAYADT